MAKYIGQLIVKDENGKDELMAKTPVVDLEPDQVENFRDEMTAVTIKQHGAKALIAFITGAARVDVVPTVAVADGVAS